MIDHDLLRRYQAAFGNTFVAMRWAERPDDAVNRMMRDALGGTGPVVTDSRIAGEQADGDKDMSLKTELAFFVVEARNGWLVRADGFVYGPYASFVLALNGAVHEAQAAGDCGFASLVLIQTSAGQPYQAAWTYGRDTYPVAGGR